MSVAVILVPENGLLIEPSEKLVSSLVKDSH